MRSFADAPRALMAAAVVLAIMLPARAVDAQPAGAQTSYQELRAREASLRDQLDDVRPGASADALLRQVRALVRDYEDAWRAFPTSGYSDNALWQGAMLSADAFWQFGEQADRRAALHLFETLTSRFRTSSLLPRVTAQVDRLQKARLVAPDPPPPTSAGANSAGSAGRAAAEAASPPATPASPVALTAIRRDVLPDALRVTFALDRETPFRDERLSNPERVFIELRNARVAVALKDARFSFGDDVVRQIRVGRPQDSRTRVVLDLEGAGRHSVYALYNPFRIVVDIERGTAKDTRLAESKDPKAPEAKDAKKIPLTAPGASWTPSAAAREGAREAAAAIAPREPTAPPATAVAPPDASPAPPPPTATAPPNPNAAGGFSLSRQLGLGIARIVIDPGHGGHDPGAKSRGATEADLVLDVALRLERLLTKVNGVEVVLTRRTDKYVALEERTAIANRAGADLFISIHANASANTNARGIETYFLNFAPNPEAEAIAARENAGSSKTMRNLPDIVRSIALNNKIDESRDLATLVQGALYDEVRKANRDARNLGVKQAPFMVLIGATMPSILAEISFITNKQEGSLLRTEKYRQQIAEALFSGVLRYQQSLKRIPTVAVQ